MAKQLAESHGFSPWKVTTIQNGIDPSRFQYSGTARRALRDAWKIPQDAIVFGSLGRFHPHKGYDVALETFHKHVCCLPERDTHFVLLGTGPMRETLERIVQDNGLQKRVTLLGFTDRPWEAYSAIDIFVMSSSYEGLPLGLLEAMACGCCPIAMAARGIPEVLTDAKFGWLIKHGDHSAFLAAMKAAVQTSPEARREMGRKAREHIVNNFNSQVQIPALVKLIETEYENRQNWRPALVASETG
jgi:glycosyltransferase involved in cell wall biosynthesis